MDSASRIVGVDQQQMSKLDSIAKGIRDDCEQMMKINERRWADIVIRIMREEGRNYFEIANKLNEIGYTINSETVRKRLDRMNGITVSPRLPGMD